LSEVETSIPHLSQMLRKESNENFISQKNLGGI
jgi:hypothetical protein